MARLMRMPQTCVCSMGGNGDHAAGNAVLTWDNGRSVVQELRQEPPRQAERRQQVLASCLVSGGGGSV